MQQAEYKNIRFSDSDVVNIDAHPMAGCGCDDNKCWMVYRQWQSGACAVGVVFAQNEQDAFDECANSGKLDRELVHDTDLADYGPEEEGIARLGNAGEPFDLTDIGIMEMPCPALSFVALFNAAQLKRGEEILCPTCEGRGFTGRSDLCPTCNMTGRYRKEVAK